MTSTSLTIPAILSRPPKNGSHITLVYRDGTLRDPEENTSLRQQALQKFLKGTSRTYSTNSQHEKNLRDDRYAHLRDKHL